MKVALCFIVSYENQLNKLTIWKKWIEENNDIINVYFHYDCSKPITDEWIQSHALPKNDIVKTSYYHVVPAYLQVMKYALTDDHENKWFIMLTDSCAPIVSPQKFRQTFFQENNFSVFSWREAWWNVFLQGRANLRLLPENYRLGNDPWFILTKTDVEKCLIFSQVQNNLFTLVCNGGLANESIFAIILKHAGTLPNVKNEISHICDWTKMSSPTSPYVFKNGNTDEITFINTAINKHNFAFFVRKIDKSFPDETLIAIMSQNTIANTQEQNKLLTFLTNFFIIFFCGLIWFQMLEWFNT
jgi:hypothetical protein